MVAYNVAIFTKEGDSIMKTYTVEMKRRNRTTGEETVNYCTLVYLDIVQDLARAWAGMNGLFSGSQHHSPVRVRIIPPIRMHRP